MITLLIGMGIAAGVAAFVPVVRRNIAANELMVAVGEARARPVLARVSRLPYAPWKPAEHSKDDGTLRVRAAAASILAKGGHDAHTSAVAMLAYGRRADALTALESLVVQDPSKADYWSDLAAARLEMAAASDDAQAYFRAVAATDRALLADTRHAGARFNRALALDALGLRFAAVDAWKQYLLLDPESDWSGEARMRLARADTPTRDELWKRTLPELERALDRGDGSAVDRMIDTFAQQARRWGEGVYLPRWADGVLSGDIVAANQTLARVRRIGAALQRQKSDAFLLDVVNAVDAAASQRQAVATACVAYRQGRIHYAARRLTEAVRDFASAERQFSAAGNPMAALAASYHGHAAMDVGDLDAVTAIVARLDGDQYPLIEAHHRWLRERIASRTGRHYEALVATREAGKAFDAAGDADLAARLRTSEAAMLARLGRDFEAWQARRSALRSAAEAGKWNLVEVALDAIVREEIDGASPEIARSLLNVQIAAPSTLPLMRFNALLSAAIIDARGTHGTADTRAARAAATRIPDPRQRADAVDELRLFEAIALAKAHPASAERHLSTVIDYRIGNNLLAHLPNIYRIRGEARRSLGRLADAEDDFRRAVGLIESGQAIADDSFRDSYLGNSGEAYLALAEHLLARDAWQEAFEVLERQRSQNPALPLPVIISALPTDVVAVHYTSFASRTLLIAMERGNATYFIVPAGRAELSSLRDRLVDSIALGDAGQSALMRQLYELLIRPIEHRLAGRRRLVIVPDDAIYGIPFAALRASTGPYVIEAVEIAIARHAGDILHDEKSLQPQHSFATIVGDPAFSAALFPELGRLPNARRDGRRMEELFPRSALLMDRQATRQAFFRTASQSDVIHLGAHALSSPRDASLSLIALSDDRGEGGVLYLREISALKLYRHPLVVLAGCQTGSAGGGKASMRTLAHAFLVAGSPAVVSTLWNVDDARASALTMAFYRDVAAGATASTALRNAQVHASRNEPVRDWAAYQLHIAKH